MTSPSTKYTLPWRDLPGVIPQDVDIFAIGDVHGQADLLGQDLQAIQDTPQQSKERHLVFIGDLID